jgi:ComF family protein
MRLLIDRIFPRMCVLCGYLESNTGLCSLCIDLLPINDNCCCVCGQPMDATQTGETPCGACQVKPPVFDRARAPCRYEFPVDAALKMLKFRRRLAFAPPLAGLMKPMIEESFSGCDVLVPVPLNRWRQARRGFNQAHELCRSLSKHTGLAILDSVIRRRATPPQSGLPAAARSKNLRGAFRVRSLERFRHPLIVDDVMTTGATCNELARELKRAGATTVCAIAVARASGR